MAVAPPDDPYAVAPYPQPPAPPQAIGPSPIQPAVITGGGYTQPDWQGLLNTYMQPYQSIYDAQIAALTGRTAAQTQLANQRFTGSDTSTMARLADEHSQLGRRIVDTLAARGLFDSGSRPYMQQQEDLRFKRANTDASNQLLDYLTGLQNQLADARFQGLLGLQNQRLNIASTLGGLYQATPNPYTLTQPGGAVGVSPSVVLPGPNNSTLEAY